MDPSTLVLQAVGGFTIGSLIGYATRKATKILLLAVGFMLLPIFVLWQLGVLYVNWDQLNMLAGEVVNWITSNATTASTSLVSAGTFGLSTTFGFLFGLSGGFKHNIIPINIVKQYRFVRRKNTEEKDWWI